MLTLALAYINKAGVLAPIHAKQNSEKHLTRISKTITNNQMKIFKNNNSTLHVQSWGTYFLMAIKGTEESILEAFNGFYNYGATASGSEESPIEPEFLNHTRTLATFSSSPEFMLRFFRNLYYYRNIDRWEAEWMPKMHRMYNNWQRHSGGLYAFKPFNDAIEKEQQDFAVKALAELQEHSPMTIIPHGKKLNEFADHPDFHVTGKVTAERPDHDLKSRMFASTKDNRDKSE